ncbi:hypothetical protein MMC30_000849 [Trapelia coarctata]|nr:hypothetical protein [Trapelia coarctata]
MVDIRMTATKAEVKALLGGTDNEWHTFETEARYEYRTNTQTFNPANPWTALNLDKKRECIARLKSICNDKGVPWGAHAAEWKLNNLHQTAIRTHKHREKKQASTVAGSSVSPHDSSASAGQGSPEIYDPVRDALKAAAKAAE